MTTDPENDLERALRLASAEPAQRPEFYRLLLAANVYVLGQPGEMSPGRQVLTAGEKVLIQNWTRKDGSPVIPFFSSLATLRQAIVEESSYLELPARALFELTHGATLVLNPKSAYGKELVPDEIAALLSGKPVHPGERVVIPQGTQVLIGQPADDPAAMVASLAKLFAQHPRVAAAYLALMHMPARDERPHLVVGIEIDRDYDAVLEEAGAVAAETAPSGGPVDFVCVRKGEGGLNEDIARLGRRFYARSFGSRLKSLLGLGLGRRPSQNES